MRRHKPSSPEALRRIAKHALLLERAQEGKPPEEQMSDDLLRKVARKREHAGQLNDAGHFVNVPEM